MVSLVQCYHKRFIFYLKFIMKGKSILLFDQHACDERVRLEDLIKKNFDGNISIESLDIPIRISFDSMKHDVLSCLIKKLKKCGN